MRNQPQLARRLAVLLPLLLLAGCLSTGKKVAETRDPFMGSASQATGSQSVAGALPQVRQTAFELQQPESEVLLEAAIALPNPVEPVPAGAPLRPDGALQADGAVQADTGLPSGAYPIDLANALGLGGADNLQVRLARTRLFQAQARHLEAKTLWLPSIRAGLGYNKHDGPLQGTIGDVIDVERNSLFYGGGLGLGAAPLAAGAGGPPRLFVNLSLADAWFQPLATCQEVAAHGAAERVASNDSLAAIAIGYHSLVEAHGMLANAAAARDLSQGMVNIVQQFEQEGFSSKTEVNRARTDLAKWQRQVAEAERLTIVRSSKLARLLRLPPQVQLAPVEEFAMPIDFVDATLEADALVALAWQSRPEIAQYAARREAACFRVKEEKYRPWIPNVQAGASGGGFGGGVSTQFPSAAGRSDVDLLAVWEWKNLGLGNVALQRQRRGELHERVLDLEDLREQIAAEVVAAAADIASYGEQIGLAQTAITAAQESYKLNAQRIQASEGLPIELLQSITALAEARTAYTSTVANYNRAQHRLQRALGNPASVPARTL